MCAASFPECFQVERHSEKLETCTGVHVVVPITLSCTEPVVQLQIKRKCPVFVRSKQIHELFPVAQFSLSISGFTSLGSVKPNKFHVAVDTAVSLLVRFAATVLLCNLDADGSHSCVVRVDGDRFIQITQNDRSIRQHRHKHQIYLRDQFHISTAAPPD